MKKTCVKDIHACPFHHHVYEMHHLTIHVNKYYVKKKEVTSLNINTQYTVSDDECPRYRFSFLFAAHHLWRHSFSFSFTYCFVPLRFMFCLSRKNVIFDTILSLFFFLIYVCVLFCFGVSSLFVPLLVFFSFSHTLSRSLTDRPTLSWRLS